jgi:tRNA threonylcarbamoyladenosine modification (KEOPS) complex  Pcc1 subunit
MAIAIQPERMFVVALSPEDGRVRITRSDTGRVALALSPEEASQIRAGLKGALRPAKKLKKRNKRKRSK